MSNDTAKRAVACAGWRWMPGMLSLPPQADRCQRDGQMMVRRLPDFTDPATVGCILALVREANGAPNVSSWAGPDGWGVGVWTGGMLWAFSALVLPVFATEADALVAALEAAEGREVSDD